MIDSFSVCNDIDKCLDYLTSNDGDDLAVGISRLHAATTSHFENHKIFCFDRSQNIANYSMSLLIRKDLELIVEINAIIRNAVEGGLIAKWHKENSVVVRPDAGHIVSDSLGMQYAWAIFYFLYFPAIIVATAVYFVECYVARKMKQPRRLKLWRYLSQCLDAHRYMWKFNLK